MKTAKIAQLAHDYIPAGGFSLNVQQDIYLYQTVTRTRIQSSSSSSSSGGSSRSSSGGGSHSSGKY
jgi:uncharacterized membrane protein YgcG